jgi:tripartite-type tricarboxylate transporter receptor subunit TctC
MVVPYTAGGNLDLIGRIVAQGLTERFGQSVYVDNRAGANGNVGTEQVARSPADGYTIAMVSAGTMGINPSLYRSMPFDPMKDLTPISLVASGPMVLVVHPSFPAKTVGELIEYAKGNPGKLNLASGGNGTLSHLSTEMLKNRTASDITHVPYKGTSLALNDLVGGQIQGMFDTLSTSMPFIESGKIRALAVTSAKRSTVLPTLPTIGEAGVRDYSADAWSGLVGPAGMPRDIVDRIRAEVVKVLEREDVRQKLATLGSEPVGSTPDEFASVIATETPKWAEIVKVSGARIE